MREGYLARMRNAFPTMVFSSGASQPFNLLTNRSPSSCLLSRNPILQDSEFALSIPDATAPDRGP